jgi:PAS domain S-box-containing protein
MEETAIGAVWHREEDFAVNLSSVGHAVLATDAEGRITRLNPLGEISLGWDETDAIGLPLDDVLKIANQESRERVVIPIREVLSTGAIHTLKIPAILIARDGSQHSISNTAVLVGKRGGRIDGVVVAFQDPKAGRDLEMSLKHLAAIVQSCESAIISKTLDGIVTSWNPGAERIFGYTAEEMIGKPMIRLFPPDRLDEEPKILACLRHGDRIDHFETMRLTKDGRQLPISVTISPIKDLSGRIVGASGIAHDLSKQRQAEEHNRTVLRSAFDGILVVNGSTLGLVEANGAYCHMSGYSRRELLEMRLPDIEAMLSPEQLDRRLKEIREQGGARFESRHRLKDRRIVEVECSVDYSKAGDDVWVIFVRDITERKRTDATLQESLAIAEKALKELSDQKFALDQHAIVAITDPRGKITYVNDKFCAISKYAREELIGKDHRIINSGHHPKEFIRELWQTIKAAQVWRGELKNRAKDGSFYWVDTTIVPLLDRNGNPSQYIAIRADVTSRKKSEELLQTANRELQTANREAEAANRAKSRFLANMSHEIRTPMNAILGYSQLMLRDPNLGADAKENLQTINRSGEHLLALINSVLEMSKIEAGRTELKPTTFSLSRVLDNLAGMFRLRAETKALDFSMFLDGEHTSYVKADEGMLRQVLINLLGNAIKFTKRGQVRLKVSLVRKVDLRLWLSACVEDTGIGISAMEREWLFQPFTQSRSALNTREGTGLGLAISREYARLMGGDITVESTPGQGSAFTFEIPIERGNAEVATRPMGARRVAGVRAGQKTPTILVVDDQFDNRDWLIKFLRILGFDVKSANNGEESILRWLEWSPQLILMDVHMPVMDGLEATRRIKASPGGKETIVVVLTASTMESERLAAMESGIDEFIAKPCDENELLEKIRKQLKIEYDYEENAGNDAGSVSEAPEIAAERLGKLPHTLLEQLRDAAQMGDKSRMGNLILKLSALGDCESAKQLQGMIDRYEYDGLEHLLEEACRN